MKQKYLITGLIVLFLAGAFALYGCAPPAYDEPVAGAPMRVRDLSVSGDLAVTGDETIGGDLTITGSTTFSGGEAYVAAVSIAATPAATATPQFLIKDVGAGKPFEVRNSSATPVAGIDNAYNLKIGDGSPGQTHNGEDAYIEGLVEIDGILYADAGITTAAGSIASTTTNAAAGSKDVFDWTATLGIMDGTPDTVNVFDINPTNASHTGSSNVFRIFDVGNITGNANTAETVLWIGSGYDQDIDAVTSLDIAVDSNTLLTLADAAAAGSGGSLATLAQTFAIMNGSDSSIGIDVNLTGANATGTDNKIYGADLGLTTADADVTEVALLANDADWDYAIDTGDTPNIFTSQTWWLDFMGDTVPAEIAEVSGSDPQAVQAMSVEQFGVYQVTSGDDGANCAADCEGFSSGLVYQADQGSLVFQARLHIDTAITNDIICFGFSDSASLEMPATIGGSDTVTRVADDVLAFCYDDAADTDEWFAIGYDATVASTGVGVALGVAPTATVYQVFRIEVDAAGEIARFYIDGTLVDTVTANAITITDPLAAFFMIDTNAAASQVVDIDYIFASAQRN